MSFRFTRKQTTVCCGREWDGETKDFDELAE